MSSSAGWIGVDLDGTLAEWGPGFNEDVRQIGRPIPLMVSRVKDLLARGTDVRIFTARVGPTTDAECQLVGCRDRAMFVACQRTLIEAWCQEYLGCVLPITATKDFHMIECWDDRCRQIFPNEGRDWDDRPGWS